MQPLFIVQQQPFVFGLTTHDALVLLNQVCVVHSLRLASLCQGQQKCFVGSGGTEVG